MRFLGKFPFIILFGTLVLSLNAQNTCTKIRPKIALVLGGGAGYGYAHRGAIK